jgi:nitroimidazol reductase NimA-like FMN-containing flavoprotein (pyridoxamine 5'-phosphate oxidase superfamily)
MDLKKLIKEYMSQMRVMQLATSVNNQPWVCNVHFYSDDNLDIYWMSTPSRRHSEEINENPKVAAVMKIHEDTLDEKYVIGLSAEGTAEILSAEEVKVIGKEYVAKLGKDAALIDDILSGKNPHKFYRMKVSKFVLFDTSIFPADPRQELVL